MSEIPSYLNEEFFKEALDNSLSSEIRIVHLELTRNTSGGNYSSDIYRATVKYEHLEHASDVVELKLLVKDLYENLSENSREHFMYVTVLPEFNATLRKCGIDKSLSPKVYLAKKTLNERHIFEDLNARGYEIIDRLKGFNEQQSKMVFWNLGQFHAVSMIYRDMHPEIVAGMKEFFCKSDPNFMSFVLMLINDNTEFVSKIVETWPGYEEIARKMRNNCGEQFRKRFLSILNKEDAIMRVIAHGDLWIKNILVLESKHGVEDAIFLDYQNCFDGSPAFDINNLLMTSVGLDVLKNKREELIEHYYEALCTTLRSCDYVSERIPTLAAILYEVKRTEYFTYYDLIFAFPQTNLSEELAKGMDFNGFFDAERMLTNRKDMFSNKRVLDTYAYVLRRLDELGVLD